MKVRRMLSVLLVVALLATCLTAFAAEDAAPAAAPAAAAATGFQFDETLTAQQNKFTGLTITAVEYVDATATDSQLASTITKIVYEGGEIAVDSEKYNAVMTVDGAQKDIKPGKYEGAVVIELVGKMDAQSGFSKFDGAGVKMTYYNTAAAVVGGGKLQKGYSVSSAIKSGEVTDAKASDVVIDSQGSFFGGLYITGSKYEISNLQMKLDGYGGDDFQGWGAGLVVTDGAEVTLNKALIATRGVIRTAIWVGGRNGNSLLNASDVVVTAFNDDKAVAYSLEDNYAVPMMEKVPFALGLAGNIRATNVLGNGTAKYTNSIVVSDTWGALSTDSGSAGTEALVVTDTLSGIGSLEPAQEGKTYTATKEVNGVNYGFTVGTPEAKSAGYVTYADAGVKDTFSNVDFYAPDYIGIIASGTSNMHFDAGCYGWSGRCGFLIHQNNGTAENGGGLYITGGEYKVADQFILVKGGNINNSYTKTNVNVDGAKVEIFGEAAQSGVFFQLMESDDAGSPGATEYTVNDPTYAEILASTPKKDVDATTGTFANMTINGDIYNSVSSVRQALDVTLDKVAMNGDISSAYQRHVDEKGETFNDQTLKSIVCFDTGWNTDYRQIGRIVNVATPAVYNDVALTLKNGTVWTVEGACYLSKLTIDEASSIVAKDGDLRVTVDGEAVTLAAGTYEGAIVVSNGEVPVFFSDVSEGLWFYDYVMALVEKGVVSGYPDNTYKPDGEVTYGEALKLVCTAAGLPAQAAGTHWASGYLTLAVASGILPATTDLDAAISRVEVAKLAASLLGFKATGESPFADTDDEFAVALYEAKIIDGYLDADGVRTFMPDATIKRSEVAKILYVMLGLDKAPEEAAPAAPEAPATPTDTASPVAPTDAAAPAAPAPTPAG